MIAPSSLPVLREFLGRALPGTSRVVSHVREQLLDFALNPMAKALLVLGPVGAGKSTVARSAGMLKRIAPLTEKEARRFTDLATFDGWGRLSPMLMPWYVELAVTGLTETLADAQLFGTVEGAYTDASDRPGVFEAAQTGQGRSHGNEEPGALLTGGVVFLDEIADLSPAHQAKLLPVLSGGDFYRVGDEGSRKHDLRYNGTTITASWRSLDHLRADLYSRIATNRIEIPGLPERMEDFDLILDDLQRTIMHGARGEIDRFCRIAQADLDRTYWLARKALIEPLDAESRNRLHRVDWGAHGNLRALTGVLQKILVGRKSAVEALADLKESPPTTGPSCGAAALFEALLSQQSSAPGLPGRLREIEVQHRGQLRQFLDTTPSARRRLAMALGVNEEDLTAKIQQLDRRRTRPGQPARDA